MLNLLQFLKLFELEVKEKPQIYDLVATGITGGFYINEWKDVSKKLMAEKVRQVIELTQPEHYSEVAFYAYSILNALRALAKPEEELKCEIAEKEEDGQRIFGLKHKDGTSWFVDE